MHENPQETASVSGVRNRGSFQRQLTAAESAAESVAKAAAKFRCSGIAQATSGSFGLGIAGVTADVKGTPPLRSGAPHL